MFFSERLLHTFAVISHPTEVSVEAEDFVQEIFTFSEKNVKLISRLKITRNSMSCENGTGDLTMSLPNSTYLVYVKKNLT